MNPVPRRNREADRGMGRRAADQMRKVYGADAAVHAAMRADKLLNERHLIFYSTVFLTTVLSPLGSV